MNYDDWKTTEPDDVRTCEEHGDPLPCRTCRLEAAEYRAECAMEARFSGDEEETS